MTRWHLLGSLALVATLATTACGQSPAQAPAAKPASAGIAVAVAPVGHADVVQSFTFTGDVKPAAEIAVLPKQSGRIVRMPVDVGAKVRPGDVIAELDHATLDLTLQQAQAGLLAAQAKLATIQAGPRAENVAQAQLAVDTASSRLQALRDGAKPAAIAQAQAQVAEARAHLDGLQHPRPETVAQAQLTVDLAKQKLATVQAGARPEAVAQAQANLDAAKARLQALNDGMRPEDRATLELAVPQAKNALYSAQISRDGACNPSNPHYQCDAANAAVNAAQTALDMAVANLKAKTAGPTQTDVQQAQAAVDQAQAAVQAAKSPYTAQDLAQAQDGVKQAEQALALAQKPVSAQDVAQAQAQVDQALAALTLVRQPYTQEDVHQAEIAVATAEQQLSLAKQPYTEQDAQTARAGVAQAQVEVDQALQAIRDTTVTAPVAGVITSKGLSEGALASPGAPIVSIASERVKVQIPVEETQVANLRLGEDATISADSLGGTTVAAKVTNVAPGGDTKSRTFTVELTPSETGSLMPGMFVRASIDVQAHKGVLAVPKAAVVQRAGKPYVFVVRDGTAGQIPVTIGLANDRVVEIADGLTPGAAVVVQGQQNLSDKDRVNVTATQQAGAPAADLATSGGL